MIELIATYATTQIAAYVSGSIAVFVLTWILKKVPTEKIRKWIYDLFFKVGAGISGFLSKWKYTKAFYQVTLEPWLIGLIDMLLGAVMHGLVDGLQSDDKEK